MHWVIWNILNVKAITPSILIRFSKFLCLNILAFQDLSFSFAEHPRGTCPRGQKRVLKIVNEKWKSQKLKKMTFPSSCEQTLGRILDLHKISDLLGQRNDVLQTLGSWRKLASMVWPLFVIIWFFFWLDGLWSMANFWGRLYGHFEILQVKIGQEM